MAIYGNGEVSWDEEGSPSGGRKSNSKDLWLRLDSGSNVIRLVTNPFQYIVHKGVKKAEDLKGYGQKVNCSNPDGKGTCPACDLGLKAGQRWLMGVIEIKTNQYKILDVSYQIYAAIKELSNNTEVWGNPKNYDINIKVNKNGGPTGYYMVQPIPHKEMSPDAKKARDAADFSELARKVTPPTPEQVQKRLDHILEGHAPFIPPAKPAASASAGKSNGGKTTSRKTPDVVPQEDESVDDIFPEYNEEAATN